MNHDTSGCITFLRHLGHITLHHAAARRITENRRIGLFLRTLDTITVMAHARTTLSQARCSTPRVAEISLKPNVQSHRLLLAFLLLSTLYHYSFTRHWGPKGQTNSRKFLAGMHSDDIAKCPLAKRYVSHYIYLGRWKVVLHVGRFCRNV